MDKLDAMQVFVRVAETSSFTRTADDLGLPRATVSAAVQQLESSLGTRLLHRTTRRVHLTQDGEAVLERCRSVLADVEEMEGLFGPAQAQVSGRLKVDVPSRMGRLVIAPALPEFFNRYPQITLELGATDRPVDLVQEGVDCAVRVGPIAESSLVARPLGQFEMVNCASPAYLARWGTPSSLEELARHLAVNYASPATGRTAPWEYVQDAERRSLMLRSQVTVNNAETYIACALAGLGLIQVPAYDVRHHLAAGELAEVLPQLRAEAMPVYALYPHRRHLSRRVQAFIEWLGSLLGDRAHTGVAQA